MLPAIIQVLENRSSDDSNEAVEVLKGHKVKLQDPVFVLRLSFLYELSYFLSLLSNRYSPRQNCRSSHEGPLLVIRIFSAGFVSLSLSFWDEAPAAAEEDDIGLAEDEDEAWEDIFESLIMFLPPRSHSMNCRREWQASFHGN